MSGKRQNNQDQLIFLFDERGEASGNATEGTETFRAERATENPVRSQQVMEAVCERENLREALKRVKANKGSPGIDGMTVDELPDYLKRLPENVSADTFLQQRGLLALRRFSPQWLPVHAYGDTFRRAGCGKSARPVR